MNANNIYISEKAALKAILASHCKSVWLGETKNRFAMASFNEALSMCCAELWANVDWFSDALHIYTMPCGAEFVIHCNLWEESIEDGTVRLLPIMKVKGKYIKVYKGFDISEKAKKIIGL